MIVSVPDHCLSFYFLCEPGGVGYFFTLVFSFRLDLIVSLAQENVE